MDWTDDVLTLWFQGWIDGFVKFLATSMVVVLAAALLVAIVVALGVTTITRRFWCRFAGRNVEVQFERRGFFRRLTSVKSCSAFECGAIISCHRRCLDRHYRAQWEPALPVVVRPSGAAASRDA